MTSIYIIWTFSFVLCIFMTSTYIFWTFSFVFVYLYMTSIYIFGHFFFIDRLHDISESVYDIGNILYDINIYPCGIFANLLSTSLLII